MAPRTITQGRIPIVGAGEIPRIQFSSGSAKALEQFSRDMFSLSNGFQDQLDAQAEAEATVQGSLAGAAGDPSLQDYGTIRGRAFNRAAIETFVTTLDTQGIAKVNELSQKHAADPDALAQELADYNNGVTRELGKVYPPAAAAFKQRMMLRQLPAVEAAKDARYKLTRDQADAALIQNEVAIKAEVTTLAGDLFSDNPDRSSAAAAAVGALQDDYLKVFEAVDPVSGRPLYSAEEKAKAKVGFYNEVMQSAALSWFDQQPDKAGAYQRFVDGDFTINLKMGGAPTGNVIEAQDQPGKIRRQPIQTGVKSKLAVATAATGKDLVAIVTSGGQNPYGVGRTGSHRHDLGGSADIVLRRDGQMVTPQQDPELYKKFLENAAAAGFTGIGHYAWGIHVGGGSVAAWGPDTTGRTLDPAFGEAIQRGRDGPRLSAEPMTAAVDVRKALGPEGMDKIATEMRSRISFNNTQRDRQAAIEEKENKAVQDAQEYEMTNRILAAGSKDPETGQPVKPVTTEEITTAVRLHQIDPKAGAAMVKLMTTEAPPRSDASTMADAQRRLYAGENIYNFVIENSEKLSASDRGELLSKNQSMNVAGEGSMSKDTQFYYDTLKDRLTPDGLQAKYDEGKDNRKFLALDEFRRRTQGEGAENARDVANDLVERATLDDGVFEQSKLGGMVRPRFSVAVEGKQRIDVPASAKALMQAKKDGSISPREFANQQKLLKQWADLQMMIDRLPTPQKVKP